MQERIGAAHAAAAMDGALEVAGALLGRAVVIRVARNAEFGRAADECFAQDARPVAVGYRQRSGAAATALVSGTDAALRALEIGQHFAIAPARVALGRPVVEIR